MLESFRNLAPLAAIFLFSRYTFPARLQQTSLQLKNKAMMICTLQQLRFCYF